MTRLVGVRAVCDGCSAAAAIVFCVAHRSVLCQSCDNLQHVTPERASHQRVELASAVTALPFCEYCDDAPATTYCDREGSTLCDKCDNVIHSSHPHPHYRTPISSTLRNRAVEFRGRTRLSSPDQSTSDHPRISAPQDLHVGAKEGQSVPQSIGSTQAIGNTTDAQLQQADTSTAPPVQSRVHSAQRRRSSKLLAKRKHRRDPSRALVTPPVSRPLADSIAPPPDPLDIVDSPEYPSFLFPSGASVDHRASNLVTPYAAFPSNVSARSPPFIDPLLVDPNVQLRQNPRRDTITDAPVLSQGFSNIVTYGSIDLSGDTALEGLNKSESPSGGSSRQRTPDFDALSHGPSSLAHRTAPGPSQPTVAALAAAAAAAAGEMYLLNSVSSGSGSSTGRLTPPLNDVNRVSDPAGVAEAATAAATAAAESASAAAGVVDGVDLSAVGVQQPVLPSRPSHNAMDVVIPDTSPSQTGRPQKPQRTVKWLSEPGIVLSTGMVRGAQSLHTQRHVFEDAMKKLDMDGGNRGMKNGAKRENRLNRPVQDVSANRSVGTSDLLSALGVSEDMFRRGPDAMGDLDMPRDEFGMFDSIDLSQFDQTGPTANAFSLPEYRHRTLDSDEG